MMKDTLKTKLISIIKTPIRDDILEISGFLFKPARTKVELDLVYKVRYKVYREARYIKPSKNKRFKDKYDSRAINFLVLDKNRPIATARLILNSKVGFWTENIFNFNPPKVQREKLARLVVLQLIKILEEVIIK